MDPNTVKVISQAAGDVKTLLDDLSAAGVKNPVLDVAENLAAGVQASLASGNFDPAALVPPAVNELKALQGIVTDPVGKAILGALSRALGKLVPPAPGA